MATSPKQPDFPPIPPRRPVDDHSKVHTMRPNKFPWLLLTILVAAALLAGIIAYLPRTPHTQNHPVGAQIPAQPTANRIQLTNVQIATAPIGNAVYLTATLHNTGNYQITGVQVKAQFIGNDGAPVGTSIGAVQSLNGDTTQNLVQDPIKPGESHDVRIYLEYPPRGWNHQVPALTVTTVTGTKS